MAPKVASQMVSTVGARKAKSGDINHTKTRRQMIRADRFGFPNPTPFRSSRLCRLTRPHTNMALAFLCLHRKRWTIPFLKTLCGKLTTNVLCFFILQMLVVTSSNPRSPCSAKRPRLPPLLRSPNNSKSSSRSSCSNNRQFCRQDPRLPARGVKYHPLSIGRIKHLRPSRRRPHDSPLEVDTFRHCISGSCDVKRQTRLLASFSYTHISPSHISFTLFPSVSLLSNLRVPSLSAPLTVISRYHPVVYRLHPSSHLNETRSQSVQITSILKSIGNNALPCNGCLGRRD